MSGRRHFLAGKCFTQRLSGFSQLVFVLLADVLNASLKPFLPAALDLIDSALDLSDVDKITLASHLSSHDLALAPEEIQDHGGLALRGPSLDGVVVAHPVQCLPDGCSISCAALESTLQITR